MIGKVILAAFICLSPNLLSSSEASKRSSQEHARIPEISTPKMESMVDVGGRKLHCCVYGSGSPTVVLSSGLEAPQVYWNPVIPDLAAKTTVLTYDRAGIGKSEIGDLPAHGEQSAQDLHVLLDKLGLPKPDIPVGHSWDRLIIVEGTGHNIHVDKPEVLIAPVVEMIEMAREKKEKRGSMDGGDHGIPIRPQ
jgi:hypothetical protein